MNRVVKLMEREIKKHAGLRAVLMNRITKLQFLGKYCHVFAVYNRKKATYHKNNIYIFTGVI